MFAPPPEIEARIHARLPRSLQRPDGGSDWFFGKSGAGLHSFLEGPCFDRAGRLLVTDIPFGRIFLIDERGGFELLVEYDGEPNGLALHRDGRIFVADHRRGLLTVDPASGEVTTHLARVRREGFKGLNDLIFDRRGNLYFTDQGQTGLQDPSGRVWRLGAGGRLDLLIDNVPSPNGLVLSPDERTLYLAVTRANQIWRLPLHDDGSTTKVNLFLQLQGGLTGPDGLAMDAEGNLVVCHCGLGTVWLFSPLGEPLLRIRSPAGLDTTNAAFGGADNATLFVTESSTGSVLAAELEVAGQPLFSHA